MCVCREIEVAIFCAGLLKLMSVPVSLLMSESTLGDKTPLAELTVQPTVIMSCVERTVATPVQAALMPPVTMFALRDVSVMTVFQGVEQAVFLWRAVAASMKASTSMLVSPSGQMVAPNCANVMDRMFLSVILHHALLHKSAPSETASWAVMTPCLPVLYGVTHITSPLMEPWLIFRDHALMS